MTHHRLTAAALPAGADLDVAAYVDEYTCDGCGATTENVHEAAWYRIQGDVYHHGEVIRLNADLCPACWNTKPAAVAEWPRKEPGDGV